ncbi:hypothetical protein PR048_018884 [Dryococelus australis]|uniref:Uncharacterized protein n=1 Tax=Dryococelus australis TaxID=614101 RepID=A0ABQ9H217_9NEOP|nr:hypothetical protein PR048_018884 [Dryococelus australis]
MLVSLPISHFQRLAWPSADGYAYIKGTVNLDHTDQSCLRGRGQLLMPMEWEILAGPALTSLLNSSLSLSLALSLLYHDHALPHGEIRLLPYRSAYFQVMVLEAEALCLLFEMSDLLMPSEEARDANTHITHFRESTQRHLSFMLFSESLTHSKLSQIMYSHYYPQQVLGDKQHKRIYKRRSSRKQNNSRRGTARSEPTATLSDGNDDSLICSRHTAVSLEAAGRSSHDNGSSALLNKPALSQFDCETQHQPEHQARRHALRSSGRHRAPCYVDYLSVSGCPPARQGEERQGFRSLSNERAPSVIYSINSSKFLPLSHFHSHARFKFVVFLSSRMVRVRGRYKRRKKTEGDCASKQRRRIGQFREFTDLYARLHNPLYSRTSDVCSLAVALVSPRVLQYRISFLFPCKSAIGAEPSRASVSLLAPHQGKPGSVPSRVTTFSHVRIVPDDAAGQRVFSGFSLSPSPCIPVLLRIHMNHPHRLQDLAVKNRVVSTNRTVVSGNGVTNRIGGLAVVHIGLQSSMSYLSVNLCSTQSDDETFSVMTLTLLLRLGIRKFREFSDLSLVMSIRYLWSARSSTTQPSPGSTGRRSKTGVGLGQVAVCQAPAISGWPPLLNDAVTRSCSGPHIAHQPHPHSISTRVIAADPLLCLLRGEKQKQRDYKLGISRKNINTNKHTEEKEAVRMKRERGRQIRKEGEAERERERINIE